MYTVRTVGYNNFGTFSRPEMYVKWDFTTHLLNENIFLAFSQGTRLALRVAKVLK
jgi:hypothetical protein